MNKKYIYLVNSKNKIIFLTSLLIFGYCENCHQIVVLKLQISTNSLSPHSKRYPKKRPHLMLYTKN